jgi:hypothetical protein
MGEDEVLVSAYQIQNDCFFMNLIGKFDLLSSGMLV